MSSLWSIFAKGKRLLAEGMEQTRLDQTVEVLTEDPPRLVNIQPIIDEVEQNPASFRMDQSWDATPPFRTLWLEWIYRHTGNRGAIAVIRLKLSEVKAYRPIPANAQHMLILQPYMEYQGSAVLVNSISAYIDEEGAINLHELGSDVPPEQESNQENMEIVMYVAAEALTTMNTRGTRIEPAFESKPATPVKKQKPNHPPFSVWHTVHLPQFSTTEGSSGANHASSERREHWVRRYRRDYRKGKGLFGHIRELVWMPEHKRGNPELGTVKQDYKLHKGK